MRKTYKLIITLIATLAMVSSATAQAPQKMSYQSVIRSASGALVANQAIGVKISLLQGSAIGTTVYVETQQPATNANGLASYQIGGGTVVSGNFASIDWANGPYFVKTETDPIGGTNYSIAGSTQLLSVAYALYAANSGTPGPTGATGPAGSNASISVGAIGSTSNANAASIASGVLTLQPANACFGGVVTNGTQTFAGNKTFNNDLTGTNANFTAADASIRLTNTSSTSNNNFILANDVSTNAGGLALFGSAYSTNGQLRANGMYVYSNNAGGLTLNAEGTHSLYLATNSVAALTFNGSQAATFSNTITTPSSITASSFKTTSGTSSQFLKADGSVDNNTYLTSAGSGTFSNDLTVRGLTVGIGNGIDYSNTAFGNGVLTSNTGARNVAIGQYVLRNTSGGDNTGLGRLALDANTTGNNNTAVGGGAGSTNSTGSGNSYLGYGADGSGTGYSNATAIGFYASVTGSNKIQLGNTSVTNVNTSGSYSGGSFIKSGGTSSQFLKADGSVDASTYLTSASLSTYAPLASPTLTGTPLAPTATAGTNTTQIATTAFVTAAVSAGASGVSSVGAIGSTSNANAASIASGVLTLQPANTSFGGVVTTGTQTFAGLKTFSSDIKVGGALTVGSGPGANSTNTVVGQAFSSNTSGANNTALGYAALNANTTGTNNIAVGNAMQSNTTGNFNLAIGYTALNDNISGTRNVAIGPDALHSGSSNGGAETDNTAIGYSAGTFQYGGTGMTFLGSNTRATNSISNATALGYGANVGTSNTIRLGNGNITSVITSGSYTGSGYITSSDKRLKTNIASLTGALNTIMQLNPVHYDKKLSLESNDYSKPENGFIAQEIQKILPFIVTTGTDKDKLLAVDYTSLIPVLTKAIQEQQKQIDELKALVEKLAEAKK